MMKYIFELCVVFPRISQFPFSLQLQYWRILRIFNLVVTFLHPAALLNHKELWPYCESLSRVYKFPTVLAPHRKRYARLKVNSRFLRRVEWSYDHEKICKIKLLELNLIYQFPWYNIPNISHNVWNVCFFCNLCNFAPHATQLSLAASVWT